MSPVACGCTYPVGWGANDLKGTWLSRIGKRTSSGLTIEKLLRSRWLLEVVLRCLRDLRRLLIISCWLWNHSLLKETSRLRRKAIALLIIASHLRHQLLLGLLLLLLSHLTNVIQALSRGCNLDSRLRLICTGVLISSKLWLQGRWPKRTKLRCILRSRQWSWWGWWHQRALVLHHLGRRWTLSCNIILLAHTSLLRIETR